MVRKERNKNEKKEKCIVCKEVRKERRKEEF